MAGVCGEREAIGAEARGGIDSKGGQDGGGEVFGAYGFFADPHRRFVGRAVDQSAWYAGTGQHGGVAVWPVISSDGGGPAADFWSSSEFADQNNQSGFQKASIFKILDESGHRGIGAWESPAETIPAVVEDADAGVSMHIPCFDADKFVIGRESHPGDDVDESDSGFDESAGHQQILSEGMSAVAVSDLWRFVFDIECALCVVAVQQRVGLFLQRGQSLKPCIGVVGLNLKLLQEIPASFHACGCNISSGFERAHLKSGSSGVVVVSFADEQRGVMDPEVSTAEIGGLCRSGTTAELLQPDMGGHVGFGGVESGHDGAEGW